MSPPLSGRGSTFVLQYDNPAAIDRARLSSWGWLSGIHPEDCEALGKNRFAPGHRQPHLRKPHQDRLHQRAQLLEREVQPISRNLNAKFSNHDRSPSHWTRRRLAVRNQMEGAQIHHRRLHTQPNGVDWKAPHRFIPHMRRLPNYTAVAIPVTILRTTPSHRTSPNASQPSKNPHRTWLDGTTFH